jgi:hypothetical protein
VFSARRTVGKRKVSSAGGMEGSPRIGGGVPLGVLGMGASTMGPPLIPWTLLAALGGGGEGQWVMSAKHGAWVDSRVAIEASNHAATIAKASTDARRGSVLLSARGIMLQNPNANIPAPGIKGMNVLMGAPPPSMGGPSALVIPPVPAPAPAMPPIAAVPSPTPPSPPPIILPTQIVCGKD